MDFITAKNIIEKTYKTTKLSSDCLQIDSNVLLDEFNYAFIWLKQNKNKLILTDFSNNLKERNIDEKILQKICNKYNLKLNNYHLECDFNDIFDILNYENCLKEIFQKK